MDLLFLTQQGGFLGPFAWVMGKILNAIYEFLSLFNVENIALCIILFTFVTKMLMLPLTIKQQKGAKLSAKMNPELQKIQAKYKGKKDQDSMRRQQLEMQEVYAKYGSSPMSGCLPLLISLPILFALYRVIYKIPAYVNDVYGMYEGIAIAVRSLGNFPNDFKMFLEANPVSNAVTNLDTFSVNQLIDVMGNFSTANWNAFMNFEGFQPIISSIQGNINDILHVNHFLGDLNILDAPGYSFPGILIPILSALSQWLVTKLSTASTPTSSANDIDNPAAQSLKTMNTVMPIVSGVFCTFLPIGVGIYWVSGSVFQIGQQFFINKYMDNMDVDEMIEKNVAKSAKKKEKMGIATGNTMAGVAKTSTKSLDIKSTNTSSNNNTLSKEASKYKKSEVSYNASSIAANANILKKRNSDKGDK